MEGSRCLKLPSHLVQMRKSLSYLKNNWRGTQRQCRSLPLPYFLQQSSAHPALKQAPTSWGSWHTLLWWSEEKRFSLWDQQGEACIRCFFIKGEKLTFMLILHCQSQGYVTQTSLPQGSEPLVSISFSDYEKWPGLVTLEIRLGSSDTFNRITGMPLSLPSM